MKWIVRPMLLLIVAVFPAFMATAFAGESPELNLAADALQSPGNPPVIPHAVKPDQDGEACNVCHRTGLKKAPPTSHPERLNCTSCHVQGEVKKEKKSAKGKRK
jgi:nitrate reductase cytochrome c-type subunit